MNLFIYSDESGVFDYTHNDFYTFGGIIFLSQKEKNEASHKFLHVENMIKDFYIYRGEIKASNSSKKNKYKLLKSLDSYIKFGVVINLKMLDKNLYSYKKTKQRYLDFAYKLGIKNAINKMIENGLIKPIDIENIYIYCDEHTTSTDGLYELKESIETEFKYGIYNYKYNTFFAPTFPNINSIEVKYLDSKSSCYIRMADIISNYVYNNAKFNFKKNQGIFIKKLPTYLKYNEHNNSENIYNYA